MEATGVYYDYAERDDVATGYVPNASGESMAAPVIHLTRGYSAGALVSTASDLYKLHRALNDTILLSRESIAAMLTPQSGSYGYGWLIDSIGGHLLTGHGGGTPGFVSIFQRWPDESLCAVVLSNNVTVPVHTIATSLAGMEMGEPVDMPAIKTPADIPPADLAAFAGEYSLTNGEVRTVTLQGPHLVARRGEGPTYIILPEGPDKFYFANDHMTTLTFLRDADGKVNAHVLQQSFDIDTAMRIQ
jgi:hypothetical protein